MATDFNNHEIIFASKSDAEYHLISKVKSDGKLIKIAPRVYTTNPNDSAENIVRRNLFAILGHLFPESVLSHRSAFECHPTPSGDIYLTYKYSKRVSLPGVTVHLVKGSVPIEGDYPFLDGLYISGTARSYLENLEQSKGEKNLSQASLEEKLEVMLRTGGEFALNNLRDEARKIAPKLGKEKEFGKLNRIIGALLNTKPGGIIKSPLAQARILGEPYDNKRLELFLMLMRALNDKAFRDLPDPNCGDVAFKDFSFFESYFSNYIEGTEFELDDAKRIIETKTPLPSRNADSHDILGTFDICSNKREMAVVPNSPEELVGILQRRHSIMLSSRENANPGKFKIRNNRAGQTHFVDYTLVRGTLKKGFEIRSALKHPFSKAVFMLFMVSEVHPFDDGNGRISRIMMNAELVSSGQSKIIIPTVFRPDYLGALRQLSRYDNPETLIKAMLRVREFSYNIQGTFSEMKAYIEKCNGFRDEEDYILTQVSNVIIT